MPFLLAETDLQIDAAPTVMVMEKLPELVSQDYTFSHFSTHPP